MSGYPSKANQAIWRDPVHPTLQASSLHSLHD